MAAPPNLIDAPRLDGWAAQWDRLVDSSPLPTPFLRSWWLTGAAGPDRHFLLVVDGATFSAASLWSSATRCWASG